MTKKGLEMDGSVERLLERFVVSQEKAADRLADLLRVNQSIASSWQKDNELKEAELKRRADDRTEDIAARNAERAEDLARRAAERAQDLARFDLHRAEDMRYVRERDGLALDKAWASMTGEPKS